MITWRLQRIAEKVKKVPPYSHISSIGAHKDRQIVFPNWCQREQPQIRGKHGACELPWSRVLPDDSIPGFL